MAILATSREILGVMGEVPFRVPPMSMPDEHSDLSIEKLYECDAVRLFVERSQVVSPGFVLSEGNAPAVIKTVRRLDGIPLAIELAAARMRLLGIEQIAQRLNDAFHLLNRGARTALLRHQALRASIDWSYNLLSEPERILLRRLSVFAGSWSLSAAEVVCADELGPGQSIQPEDVLDLLAELADKSLVSTISETEGRNRFRMLETVRQYAYEKLVDAQESDHLRTNHLMYYLALAEQLEPRLNGREQIKTLKRLEQELDNINLALEWGLHTNVEAQLRLAAALLWFWDIRSHRSECVDWLEKGLDLELATRPSLPKLQGHPQSPRALIRAKALRVLGIIRNMQFYFPQARVALEESLEIYRQSGVQNDPHMAEVLLYLFGTTLRELVPDKLDLYRTYTDEAMGIMRAIDDQHGLALGAVNAGWIETDLVRRTEIHQEGLSISEVIGDTYSTAWNLLGIGQAYFINGDYAKSLSASRACKERSRLINDVSLGVWCDILMARAFLSIGDFQSAEKWIEEGLAVSLEYGYEFAVLPGLTIKYLLRIAEGKYRQAEAVANEYQSLYQKTSDKNYLAYALCHKSKIARLRGESVHARQYAEEALNFIVEEGANHSNIDSFQKNLVFLEFGYIALQEGNPRKAGTLFRDGVRLLNSVTGRIGLLQPLDAIALLAICERKQERAVRLHGTRWVQGAYYLLSPIERDQRDADLLDLRNSLGDERFEQLSTEGRAMSLDEAVAYALEERD